jgi:pimeloyl-ACP methyl ester carboxylesterase
LVAEANAQVSDQLMDEFRSGTALADLEALPSLASIGIGHSLGGMLTVLQQAQHRSHDAVALLGFSCNGLPGVLKPEELALAHGAAGPSRAEVARLARARFPEPYPEVVATAQGRELFSRAPVDRQAVNALAPARDRLLAVGATLSILPGGVAGECALIDVPLFLGVGDLDFCGPPREIPASFPASTDITLLILPETGHTHFLFPSRRQLFDRLATWAHLVADGSGRKE